MLETHIRSKALNFLENAVFQHNIYRPHIIPAARSHVDDMIPNSHIGRYGATGWPSRWPDLVPWRFSSRST